MKNINILIILTLMSYSAFANEKLADSISNLYKSTLSLAASDLSCSQNSECAALALGSRACGGPNGYTVYSVKNTRSNELKQLGALLEELEKGYNLTAGMASICSIPNFPVVSCQSNICTIQ